MPYYDRSRQILFLFITLFPFFKSYSQSEPYLIQQLDDSNLYRSCNLDSSIFQLGVLSYDYYTVLKLDWDLLPRDTIIFLKSTAQKVINIDSVVFKFPFIPINPMLNSSKKGFLYYSQFFTPEARHRLFIDVPKLQIKNSKFFRAQTFCAINCTEIVFDQCHFYNTLKIQNSRFDNINIENCIFDSVFLVQNIKASLLYLLGNSNNDNFKLSSSSIKKNLFDVNSFKKKFVVSFCDYKVLSIISSEFLDTTVISGCHYTKQDHDEFSLDLRYGAILEFAENTFNRFQLVNSVFKKLVLSGNSYPELIAFQRVYLSDPITIKQPYPFKSKILIMATALDKLNIDFERIGLIHYTRNQKYLENNRDQVLSLYNKFLDENKDHHLNSSYENLYLEYIYFKKYYYGNFGSKLEYIVRRNWNNFGFDKSLILWNSLGIWWILSIVPAIWFKQLNKYAYKIKKLENRFPSRNTIKNPIVRGAGKMGISIIYTGIIFWNLRLDVHALKFEKMAATIYVLFIYGIGVFCVANLVNYIITY